MTYYGRWPYKYEKATELGAAGVLIIHDTKGAAYGWDVLRASWAQRELLRSRPRPPPSLRGLDRRRDGRPRPGRGQARPPGLAREGRDAGVRARAAGPEGHGPPAPRSTGRSTASTSPASSGPSIPRPAAGRSSSRPTTTTSAGTRRSRATRSTTARSTTAPPRPRCWPRPAIYAQRPEKLKDDLCFVAVTAEEQLVLGSAYFARHLPFDKAIAIADINFEMTNVWGETEDVFAIGARHSDLDAVCREAAEKMGLRYTPSATASSASSTAPTRSRFARAGIPGVWLSQGVVAKGPDKGLVQRKFEDYRQGRNTTR
ncbi:MAG: M28 family peptidase [Marinilabiliales bacterium]|nr:M28 family peptidase [Marinilabiliales bacterium]